MNPHNDLATHPESVTREMPAGELTVQRAENKLIEENQTGKKQTSMGLVLLKWVATILIFGITITCLVVSKLMLISIAQLLNPSELEKEIKGKPYLSDVAFVMVISIMLIPNFISFIRTFMRSAFSNSEPWPSKSSILFGIIGSVLEVGGLCLFAFILVPTTLNFGRAILLMNGIFIFPIIFHSFISLLHKSVLCNFRQLKRLIPAGLIALGGLLFVELSAKTTMNQVTIPVFMISLSLAWSPKMFKYQTEPSRQSDGKVRRQKEASMESDNVAKNIRIESSRNNITFVTSIIKIILTIAAAFVLNHFLVLGSTKKSHVSLQRGLDNFYLNDHLKLSFSLQIVTTFFGYAMCWLACTMNLQKICFVIPLALSTPISVVLSILFCDKIAFVSCPEYTWKDIINTVILGGLFCFSQLLSHSFQFWKSEQFLMAPEERLFWLPSYDGCLLEQYILLNRKNEVTDEYFVNYHGVMKKTRIYICTTMYHERDYEMEQFLTSLARVDKAMEESGRQFEAHVFFDDGAKRKVVMLYALQFLSLVKDTIGYDPGEAIKLETPYGLQLKWDLPERMSLILHLKDKEKVKSKKRWSQVMYMSYVLDFKSNRSQDDFTFILVTDADVKFTPNDVMALMDLMSRSPNVGAVCGRTHPIGSGPLVWYQVFDYAIGHWLLKVANHVCGSVLYSPGCFSVYRARAIRDVLPNYASRVDCAMDFLMKDNGEDRWFCTLLVEAGWKLEYCAMAENSTYCPESFDEFFEQRRRWVPSTFANSLVLLNKQSSIRTNNNAISLFFIVYQIVLLVSSIIGPSTVILVVAGGLEYAYPADISLVWAVTMLVITSAVFTLICLFCRQDTQLKWAKFLTFIFAIIMCFVLVGIMFQIGTDAFNYVTPPTKAPPTAGLFVPNVTTTKSPREFDENKYIFTPSNWYLLIITSVFILTAMLHGADGINLIYGVWYLLCLPSGYLLLTIYSVTNLTDRSWGTREGKTDVAQSESTWYEKVAKYFEYFCWCCIPSHLRQKPEEKQSVDNQQDQDEPFGSDDNNKENGQPNEKDDDDMEEIDASELSPVDEDHELLVDVCDGELPASEKIPAPEKSAMKKSALKRYPSSEMIDQRERLGSKEKVLSRNSSFRFSGEKTVKLSVELPIRNAATPVEEWLSHDYEARQFFQQTNLLLTLNN